jgi:hypothetical protein
MTTKEQQMIAGLKDFADWGYITPGELDWCMGAILNRHDLTNATRRRLGNTVLVILKKAHTRALIDLGKQ